MEAQEGNERGEGRGNGVAIACLFTSYGYGGRAVKGGKNGNGGHAAKDGVGKVKESTKVALKELRRWIGGAEGKEEQEKGKEDEDQGDGRSSPKKKDSVKRKKRKIVVYSPKFNSGNFGVDWDVTADMIREAFADWEGEWRILADR